MSSEIEQQNKNVEEYHQALEQARATFISEGETFLAQFVIVGETREHFEERMRASLLRHYGTNLKFDWDHIATSDGTVLTGVQYVTKFQGMEAGDACTLIQTKK